jgi:hypothetical protein
MPYAGIGLPGRILGPSHEPCEGYNNDCREAATVRVQGETDSFGFEEIHWCDGCHKLSTQPSEEEESHFWCGWCKKKTNGSPVVTRDWSEGSTGPVYWVCGPCDKANMEDMENY